MTIRCTLIALLLSTTFCFGQADKNDCSKFRTGKYTYKEEPYNNVIVKRTRNRQKEHQTTTGLKIKYKIEWTGHCEYKLIRLWSNDKEINEGKGSEIEVKITSVHNNEYRYTAYTNGGITEYTMIRLE